MKKNREKAIFGDFQTPLDLAREVTSFVRGEEPDVSTVVEPTCGADREWDGIQNPQVFVRFGCPNRQPSTDGKHEKLSATTCKI